MEQTKKKRQKELVIYQAKSGAIEFRGEFGRDTIWATQKQIADVFGVTPQNITMHIKRVYADGELSKKATSKESLQVQMEGSRKIKRSIKEYNLDVIIAVGYRISSVLGTQFRIWATKVLRQHITQGYTINRKIIGKNYDSFIKAVSDVEKLLPKNHIIPTEDIISLIKVFAGTWLSLESYDEEKFPKKGFTRRDVQVHSDELYAAVDELKKNLRKKKQATDLFAQEKRDGNLEGIFGNVTQAVFGNDVYGSIEEKAAHLLYFVVKNHPFTDGNKRTGAFAFIWFLNRAHVPFR